MQTGIIVNINATADLKLAMEIGKLEEQVTVVAQTPVVQAKKTQVQSNINYEMLQSLPSARDPWVMLQLTPSVFIDRENIGGNGIRTAVPVPVQGLDDAGMDRRRHADHRSAVGRLPRVFRLRRLRRNAGFDGHAGRRAPRPRHRHQHGVPPRRKQDLPGRPVLLHRRTVPVARSPPSGWPSSASSGTTGPST